jgi:hypothetical protein
LVLTIEAYDAAESEARKTVGYTEHAAFGTKTFDDHWFPSRMTREDELFRYIDWYHDQDLRRLEPGLFFRDASLATNYSVDEVHLLSRLGIAVGQITEKSCGRKLSVLFNHQGSIGLFRTVQAICSMLGKEGLSVFEVGPGCGYLGAMLALSGHTYASYDVTQGYYLWQNRLLDNLFGEEFTEFAANPDADPTNRTRVSHMPWWVFRELYKDCPIEADIVISNANLGEMHVDALKYMLRLSKMMMDKSDIGMLLFANMGACYMSPAPAILTELQLAGYDKIMEKQVYGYLPRGKGADADIIAALEDEIPLFDPSGLGKTVQIRDFIDFDPENFSDEMRFNAFIRDWPDEFSKR